MKYRLEVEIEIGEGAPDRDALHQHLQALGLRAQPSRYYSRHWRVVTDLEATSADSALAALVGRLARVLPEHRLDSVVILPY